MSKDFTRKEVEYLRSVPAVKKVAKNRITYARAFQLYCMARYLRGDGPTAIFRSVGLDPDVVGRKRIERCIARWKQDEQLMAEAQQMNPDAAPDVRDRIILVQCSQIKELTQQLSELQKRLADPHLRGECAGCGSPAYRRFRFALIDKRKVRPHATIMQVTYRNFFGNVHGKFGVVVSEIPLTGFMMILVGLRRRWL